MLSGSSTNVQLSTAALPEALYDALGQVVAEQRRNWEREHELHEAQSRALHAELRAEFVEFKELVRAHLVEVKDGAPGQVGPSGPAGPPGPQGEHGEIGPKGDPGRDGADANPKIVARVIEGPIYAYIDEKMKNVPVVHGRDGKDGKDGIPGRDGEIGSAGPQGLQGERGIDGHDGKDADPETVARFVGEKIEEPIHAFIKEQIEKLPKPKDGKDGVCGEVGPAGPPGPQGSPGESIIGPIGPRGEPGRDGKDANINRIMAEIDKLKQDVAEMRITKQASVEVKSDLSDAEFAARVDRALQDQGE